MLDKLLDKHKLEAVLIKHWTDVFDIRDILKYAQKIANTYLPSNEANKQINNLSISRFELSAQGIIIWLNYTVIERKIKYKATSEILSDFNGNFQHIQSFKD